MLVMSDETYPVPGVSFGRIDQYRLPYWNVSIREGMDRDFGKEILKCFWIHCDTVYDAMIRIGKHTFKFIDDVGDPGDQTAKLCRSWIPGVYYTKD